MYPSPHSSTNVPEPIFLTLLTVLLTVTPLNVHAQPPTPTPTQSTDYLYESKVLWIALGGVVGLLLLCSCCNACYNYAATRRSHVRDVEGRLATSSGQTRGQGHGAAAPAPPPQALTKEEVLGIDTANEWEQCPPPYYPVSRLFFTAKDKEKLTSAMVDLARFMTFGVGKPPPLPPPPLQKAAMMPS